MVGRFSYKFGVVVNNTELYRDFGFSLNINGNTLLPNIAARLGMIFLNILVVLEYSKTFTNSHNEKYHILHTVFEMKGKEVALNRYQQNLARI